MPIDPYIARGTPGVDITNTLAQIVALRQRDQALKVADERNRIADDRTRMADERQATADSEAKDEKQLKHLLAKTEWALRSGDPEQMRKAILSDPNIDPRAVEMISGMDATQLKTGLERFHADTAAKLGVLPPEQPGEIKLQDLGGGVQAVTQGGKIQGSPRFPAQAEQYSPQLERRVQKLPGGMEQEYTFDQRTGKKSNFSQPYKATSQPRVLNDPIEGPTEIVTDDSGNTVARPIPREGAAAEKPTINRAQAISEARAAIRKGLDRKEAVKRLQAAGIDPAGL